MSTDEEKIKASIAIETLEKVETEEQNMDSGLSEEYSASCNGLDPMEVALITSNGTEAHQNEDDTTTTEFLDSLTEKEADVTNEEDTEKLNEVVETTSPLSNESSLVVPKMSREMRNLQRSTQDSKVLSNFLNDSDYSPRIRRKTIKDINTPTNESDTTPETPSMLTIDNIEPLKGDSPDDSDSTVVLRDEGVEKKRRKSVSRSRLSHRAKSIASRSRAKSLSRIMNDEMTAISDKEEVIEEEDLEDDMTNISLTIMKPIENRAPNPPPKPGWDSFCFKCHLDNAVLSLACKKCKCSFHRHCARLLFTPIPKNPDDFVCADCLEIDKLQNGTVNKYNHPKIDQHTLKDILITILEKIRTYPDSCYENDIQFKSIKETNQPLIITQMSLKTIEERIMNNYYKVSEAFLHDVKLLEHNWTIVDKNKTKTLKNILKFVVTEINEMEACVHCYSSSFVISNWFTVPCKRPHLLIWAKLKGYPYWPAKVMSIDNQKLYADVRFFGAHDRAWVPTSHCLLFSEKDPNKTGKTSTPNTNKATSKSQKGIADAMKEKDEYIQNVREKYGFRFSITREPLDPNMFHKQLEAQLPNLKRENTNGNDKTENDYSQKEKLTLKIVKTSDGTQTIEKTPKIGHDKDRHILYTVLSKNEDGSATTDQSRVKAIILKRNKHGDSEKEKSKNVQNNEDSETSESIISFTDGKMSTKGKSIRDTSRQKKNRKSISSRSTTPEPLKKKAKTLLTNNENELLEKLPEKLLKRSRSSIFNEKEAPSIIPISSQKVPAGTHEIHSLRESPSPKANSTLKKNNRSKSVEKESIKSDRMLRRLSVTGSSIMLSRSSSSSKSNISKQSNSTERRHSGRLPGSSRKRSSSQSKKIETHSEYNPNLIIKDEPVTDEEIVQRERVTVNDIADLVGDGGNKRKTILISTSDNSNDSFSQNSKARKTFPNSLPINRLVDTLQAPRNTNAMVCIPQVFPSEVVQTNTTMSTNGLCETDPITLTSVQSNLSDTIQQVRSDMRNIDLPRLVPKPTGAFMNEGNTFQPESGAVSALFSENAHRMTDYFKSLLIDTIGAISSGVTEAQNVLLKLEIEKMKQQMNTLKAENQMKVDKLKKEHADEIRILKLTYEEKIKNIQQNNDQEKLKLVSEIRQQSEIDKQRAIEAAKREVKRITWCSNCTKEARFYCCWNTSYCGPACQKNHWQNHQKYCTNRNSSDNTTQSPVNTSNRHPDAIGNALPVSSPVQNFNQMAISVQRNKNVPTSYIAIPKNPAQQVGPTQVSPVISNNVQSENTIRSPQGHTIIQTGPKASMQSVPFVYQQKLPPAIPPNPLKATLPLEQSPGIQNNIIIRTINHNQNITPPLTIVQANELQPPLAIVNNGSLNLQNMTSNSQNT